MAKVILLVLILLAVAGVTIRAILSGRKDRMTDPSEMPPPIETPPDAAGRGIFPRKQGPGVL